jgi:hypothetical protein
MENKKSKMVRISANRHSISFKDGKPVVSLGSRRYKPLEAVRGDATRDALVKDFIYGEQVKKLEPKEQQRQINIVRGYEMWE